MDPSGVGMRIPEIPAPDFQPQSRGSEAVLPIPAWRILPEEKEIRGEKKKKKWDRLGTEKFGNVNILAARGVPGIPGISGMRSDPPPPENQILPRFLQNLGDAERWE